MLEKSFRSASGSIFCSSLLISRVNARQIIIRDQGQDREAGADLHGIEINGADRPGFGQHFQRWWG